MTKFTKYHGCGNDFLIVKEVDVKSDIKDAEKQSQKYSELAKKWCARTTGIGADGFIVVRETGDKSVPLEMLFYNSDGSIGPMCGNGIRCFSHFCYDEKIIDKDNYTVKTLAGNMSVNIITKDNFVVEINMGKPDFNPKVSAIDTDKTDS